jgi:hypothetical protein
MTDDAAFGRKNQLDVSQIASAEVGVSHIENTPGGLAPGLTNSSCDCGTSTAVSDQIAYMPWWQRHSLSGLDPR